MKQIQIATSGTGIERASRAFKDKSISDVLSVSYSEMLLSKKGESKYFSEDYINGLDPVKNKTLVKFLKKAKSQKAKWIKTLGYAPDVNFFKLNFPEKHRNEIHQYLDDDDLTGWSKILSDVNTNSHILKPIIRGLFDKTDFKDFAYSDALSLKTAIQTNPKVVQFFVATPTNKELDNLKNLFQDVLGDGYIIRALSGLHNMKNSEAEEAVKQDIKKCKKDNLDGVIVLSMNMGSRSFSVSETDAVVLMFDNGSTSQLVQKISRALTGGKNYSGGDKKVGNVISLALDPNTVDPIDIYIVEEANKNKTPNESFESVIRRIKRSINIFTIDSNGKRVELLGKEDFYQELIAKFSFDRLKNTSIDITPLISDKELRDTFLNINSSELKKKEKKLKQLKGKGKKYDDDDSDEKDKNDKKDEIDRLDIELIRTAVLTINNSLLNILAIDDSLDDREKSFRKTLVSIQESEFKTNEFVEMYNITPEIVITLLDRDVINEEIIDICISNF